MGWGRTELVAEVYDLDKPIGFSYGDIEYYTRHLRDVPGRILEVATGTGRILLPLLEDGHDAEGLDHSAAMLEVCRRHCRAHGFDPPLHESDMSSFLRPGRYEAVIIPAGSIGGVSGREATLSTLRACHGSLVPGGRLLVDLAPPRPDRGPKPLRHWRSGPFLLTLATVDAVYDAARDSTTELLRYEKWRDDGSLVTTELHAYTLQHWSQPAFEALLAEAGFTGVHVTANYDDDRRPGSGDDDWTFHAVRS